MAATTILTYVGKKRTYTLVDNGTGATRNVLARFQITDSNLNGKGVLGNVPYSFKNIGPALERMGKYVEYRESQGI